MSAVKQVKSAAFREVCVNGFEPFLNCQNPVHFEELIKKLSEDAENRLKF